MKKNLKKRQGEGSNFFQKSRGGVAKFFKKGGGGKKFCAPGGGRIPPSPRAQVWALHSFWILIQLIHNSASILAFLNFSYICNRADGIANLN